jgi:hypothetical protein
MNTKTRKPDQDDKTAVEQKQATDEHRWTQMKSAPGGDHHSGDSAHPRKLFPIRASEGSSVFNLLFPK